MFNLSSFKYFSSYCCLFFFFFTCNLKLSHLFVNLHDSKIVTKLVFLTRQVPKEEFFFFFPKEEF